MERSHSPDENKMTEFFARVRSHCKLPVNMALPSLRRGEGGLGGNENKSNKQIRYVDSTHREGVALELRFGFYNADDNTERWTCAEARDLTDALEQELDDLFCDTRFNCRLEMR